MLSKQSSFEELLQHPSAFLVNILTEIQQGNYHHAYLVDTLYKTLSHRNTWQEDAGLKEAIQDIIHWCRAGMQVTNPQAMMLLGVFHHYGMGCTKDYIKGIGYYEQAIALGYAPAMHERAVMHCQGQGGPQNYAAAIVLFEQAITLGYAPAMHDRAIIHCKGQGGPQDYAAAIVLFEQAITLGYAPAMHDRAIMHFKGQGGPQNYAAAIVLFEQAITLGDPSAMHNRAVIHCKGGPQDYAAAIVLFEQAITLGYPPAMHNRAIIHCKGQGGPQDYAAAIVLFEQAITLGYPPAMHDRAIMHFKGQGGPQNYAAAIVLFEQAITLGDPPAMHNRAVMHYRGQGGPKNEATALWLFERAYRGGFASAKDRIATIALTDEQMPELIALLWADLIANKSFSEHTLTRLQTQGQEVVLAKLHDSGLATSIVFLKQLHACPTHLIRQVIGPIHYKSLVRQVPSISATRVLFFTMQADDAHQPSPAATLPLELRKEILSLVQPGLAADLQAPEYADTLVGACLRKS